MQDQTQFFTQGKKLGLTDTAIQDLLQRVDIQFETAQHWFWMYLQNEMPDEYSNVTADVLVAMGFCTQTANRLATLQQFYNLGSLFSHWFHSCYFGKQIEASTCNFEFVSHSTNIQHQLQEYSKENYYFHATSIPLALDIVQSGVPNMRHLGCTDFSRQGAFYLYQNAQDALQWCSLHANSMWNNHAALLIYHIDREIFTRMPFVENHIELQASHLEYHELLFSSTHGKRHKFHSKDSIMGPCKSNKQMQIALLKEYAPITIHVNTCLQRVVYIKY